MYDLIAGHPPFDQEEIASVLWRIGSGQTTSLQDIDCNARLKVNFAFVTLDVDHYKKKGLYHLTLARCEFQHFSHFFFVFLLNVQVLIESCWSYDVCQRPSCVEVVRRLQPSALLCKSHSCSEPERLNRLGMCKLAC